jgi:hypothetical protein
MRNGMSQIVMSHFYLEMSKTIRIFIKIKSYV